jgi:hypothetical protein
VDLAATANLLCRSLGANLTEGGGDPLRLDDYRVGKAEKASLAGERGFASQVCPVAALVAPLSSEAGSTQASQTRSKASTPITWPPWKVGGLSGSSRNVGMRFSSSS